MGSEMCIRDRFNPMGALKYLNLPCGSRNVVVMELCSSRASWKYPCTASNFANILPLLELLEVYHLLMGKDVLVF